MNWRLPSRARRVVAKKAIRTAVAAKRIEEIAHPVDEVVVAVVADVDAANNAISSALCAVHQLPCVGKTGTGEA